jgi:hypothetical protein
MLPLTNIFGSPGAQSVIVRMTPDNAAPGGKRIVAPTNTLSADLRVSDAESVHEWFKRVIGGMDTDRRIEQIAVEDNFAFFGELSWQNNAIHHCNFQALITAGMTLKQYYSQGGDQSFYYRLDTDLSALGKLFSHPHPHIHAVPKDSPRFPFVARTGEFILVSFLEFIFLNHFHDSWLKWAESKAATRVSEEVFAEIVLGFEYGNSSQLSPRLDSEIINLKTALGEAKRAEVPNSFSIRPLCELLTYP